MVKFAHLCWFSVSFRPIFRVSYYNYVGDIWHAHVLSLTPSPILFHSHLLSLFHIPTCLTCLHLICIDSHTFTSLLGIITINLSLTSKKIFPYPRSFLQCEWLISHGMDLNWNLKFKLLTLHSPHKHWKLTWYALVWWFVMYWYLKTFIWALIHQLFFFQNPIALRSIHMNTLT